MRKINKSLEEIKREVKCFLDVHSNQTRQTEEFLKVFPEAVDILLEDDVGFIFVLIKNGVAVIPYEKEELETEGFSKNFPLLTKFHKTIIDETEICMLNNRDAHSLQSHYKKNKNSMSEQSKKKIEEVLETQKLRTIFF